MMRKMTKNYDFSEVIKPETLPGYIKHYITENDKILTAYKTPNDHGVFTDKKIVLFDSIGQFKTKKKIYTIPYESVTTISVSFDEAMAELDLELNNGRMISLMFDDLEPEDKVRIRLLYTCINHIVCDQEPDKKQMEKLINNDVSFK